MTVQSALNFIPWQICSIEHHLDLFVKHPASLQGMRENLLLKLNLSCLCLCITNCYVNNCAEWINTVNVNPHALNYIKRLD